MLTRTAPATDLAVTTTGLTKLYGPQVGVTDLDLEVRRGEVMGLLGPNGAGKTTTLRMLVGLVRPTRGSARLLGQDILRNGAGVRARVGYLPGDLALWDHMTGAQLLGYLARLRGGMPAARYEALADRLQVDLHRRVRELSKGNRQKIGLVQALMHQPDLLVLDEPTSGLDPVVQGQFEALIREQTDRGVAVLLSSHVLDEVQRLADRAAVLQHGHLLTVDAVSDMRERTARRVRIEFGKRTPPDVARLAGVDDVAVRHGVRTCRVRGSSVPLLQCAIGAGAFDATVEEADLEDAFLDLVEEGPYR